TIPRCSPWTTRSPTRHSWAAAPAARKERPNEHPGAQTAADRGTPAAHRAVQADAPRGGLLRRPGVLLPAGVRLVRTLVVLGAGRVDCPAALRGSVGADRRLPHPGQQAYRRPAGGRPGGRGGRRGR